MKKIIIGSLVGAIIYFAFQTVMWVGGFHRNFYSYAEKQDTVLKVLSANLPAEGMFMMPMADPNSPDFKARQEKMEKLMPGKPWAMVFYHPKMNDFSASYLLLGVFYALLAACLASTVLFFGRFPGFWSRFLVSMAFAVFTLAQGVLGNMNWWSFPWSFIQPQVMDLLLGWGLTSAWLAWYVKSKA
jgi:hypothetical protein